MKFARKVPVIIISFALIFACIASSAAVLTGSAGGDGLLSFIPSGGNTASATDISEETEKEAQIKNNVENTDNAAIADNGAALTAQEETTEKSPEKSEILLTEIKKSDSLLGTSSLMNVINPMTALSYSSDINAVPGTEYTDLLLDSAETKTYSFSVSERGYISYYVKHDIKEVPTSGTGWYAYLYEEYNTDGAAGDTAYRQLNLLTTDWTRDTDTSVNIGVMPGNYRLVVTSSAVYTQSVFRIGYNFTESTEYEIECNDTVNRYTEIYSSMPIKGTSSYFTDKKDIDYYLIRVMQDGKINLTFSHENLKYSTVAWRIGLYDENGNELYYQNSAFSVTKIQSGSVGVRQGNYYIAVYSHIYSSGEYELKADFTPDSAFEHENNNSINTADVIMPNSYTGGAIVSRSSGGDRDYYTFTLEKAGYVNIGFVHASAAAGNETKNGWNITLSVPDGKLLYTCVSGWMTKSLVSPAIGLAPGTYCISIDSENLYLNNTDYYIALSFTETLNWEKEPDDSFDTATLLYKDVPMQGALIENGTDYDTDYFTFSTDSAANVKLCLEHAASEQDREGYVIRLYNSEFVPIGVMDADGNYSYTLTGEVVTDLSCSQNKASVSGYYANLPAGTYYVRLSTGLFYTSENYYITYSLY